jgi:uncharacterized RDD family membrane protein YckC
METNPYAAPNAPLDPGVEAAGAAVRVGFWPRVGATVIDFVVVVGIGLALTSVVSSLFHGYIAETIAQLEAKMAEKTGAMKGSPQIETLMHWQRFAVGAGASVGLVGFLYMFLEGLTGRSLGKLALGLRIADVQGRILPVSRLLARMAIKHADRFLTIAGLLAGVRILTQIAQGPFWIIVVGFLAVLAKHRQGLHDLAAKTAVYRNSDLMAR